MAKPNSIENTINGSIAFLLKSPTKSSAVKKFTTISAIVACSPTASASISVHALKTGGYSFINTNIINAAMAPVITKVRTVVPMIFPALLRLFILATELDIEANTKGTTTQNIMFINTVPKGFSFGPKSGANHPTSPPAIIAPSIIARKR